MAYLTTGEYAVKPRVSRDDKYVHICLGAHNIIGLSRTEAILLAADLMDAVEARSFEHVEVLPQPLEAAIKRNEVKA